MEVKVLTKDLRIVFPMNGKEPYYTYRKKRFPVYQTQARMFRAFREESGNGYSIKDFEHEIEFFPESIADYLSYEMGLDEEYNKNTRFCLAMTFAVMAFVLLTVS